MLLRRARSLPGAISSLVAPPGGRCLGRGACVRTSLSPLRARKPLWISCYAAKSLRGLARIHAVLATFFLRTKKFHRRNKDFAGKSFFRGRLRTRGAGRLSVAPLPRNRPVKTRKSFVAETRNLRRGPRGSDSETSPLCSKGT